MTQRPMVHRFAAAVLLGAVLALSGAAALGLRAVGETVDDDSIRVAVNITGPTASPPASQPGTEGPEPTERIGPTSTPRPPDPSPPAGTAEPTALPSPLPMSSTGAQVVPLLPLLALLLIVAGVVLVVEGHRSSQIEPH